MSVTPPKPVKTEPAQVVKMQDELRQDAKQSFQTMCDINLKAAEKKRKENQDFGDSLLLACMITETKLFIHYQKLLESILDARDIKDAQAQQRHRETLRENPVPIKVILPEVNQSPAEYRAQILMEAKGVLENIVARKEELQKSIIANWGADTWEEGLKIQAATVHKEQAEKIENLEFLSVITKPDGSLFDSKELNLDEIKPEAIQEAKDAFHHVNDVLLEHIKNMEPDKPEEEWNPRAYGAAPEAPALPEQGYYKKSGGQVGFQSHELEDRIKFIGENRKAWQKIHDPFVSKTEVDVNGKDVTVDANSNIRLAAKSTQIQMNVIAKVEQKGAKFIEDKQQVAQLAKQQAAARQNIAKLEAEGPSLRQSPGNR